MPKIDVRAATFLDGKLLLVKERESGGWTLPGGYVDVNETLSQATAREVLEEAGLVVRPTRVAAIYDHRQHGYSGLPEHVSHHLETTAQLHRENGYDRLTKDVETVTGIRPTTIGQWVREHSGTFQESGEGK